MHYDTRQMYFIIYSNSVISNMEYDFKVKEILVRNKWKKKMISILKKSKTQLKDEN